MPGDPDKNQADWFAEFKKANKGGVPSKGQSGTESSSAPAGKPTDRRRHLRFEIADCRATLYREGVLTVFGVGKGNRARAALDLSEGGARFLVHERLPIGTKVRMCIQIEKFKDAVEGSGEVRWCYQSARQAEDFYVGIQFSDLEPAQARKIAMMRDWFTSPQYRAVRETRQRQRPGESLET
jgi:hypothetical protein